MVKIKCEYCGKEYIENPDYDKIIKFFSGEESEKFRYIPNCDCLKKIEEKRLEREKERERLEKIKFKIKRFKDISTVGTKFFKSTFENSEDNKYIRGAKKYSEKFVEKGNSKLGLIFYGESGTGKTHITSCIGNYLMKNNKTVVALNLDLYLLKIKSEWGDTEKELLELIRDCDLLIIDDFGSESNLSEWAISKTFNLIDIRYRNEKPIIISTNLNYDMNNMRCGIYKKFTVNGSNRIKDRIKEMCYPVFVEGVSKRQVQKNEFRKFMEE